MYIHIQPIDITMLFVQQIQIQTNKLIHCQQTLLHTCISATDCRKTSKPHKYVVEISCSNSKNNETKKKKKTQSNKKQNAELSCNKSWQIDTKRNEMK